jgi:Arc/MetJ-type ribon-helix-helix transcriptional regulator
MGQARRSRAASRRRNVWLPDSEWERIQLAALQQSVELGQRVTASEWIRCAIRERLDRVGRCPETGELDL